MKILYRFLIIYIGLNLAGCAAMSADDSVSPVSTPVSTPESTTPAQTSTQTTQSTQVQGNSTTTTTTTTTTAEPQEKSKRLKTTPACAYPPKKEKDPISVSVYNHGQKPAEPYQVIGTETISKYNFVGVKRQEASIRDVMRKLAASMGGDAIINIKHQDKTVTGTVVAYQKHHKKNLSTSV
jgi:hypothetical protein